MFFSGFKTSAHSGKTSFSIPFTGVGWLTLACYVGFYFLYLNGPHTQTRVIREVLDWLLVISLLFLYWQGYQALIVQETPKPFKILGFGAAFVLLALFTPPFHSTDLYGYINRGWQQAHYGMNPYVFVIDDIPRWGQDPMIRDHWVNNPCPYGFFFAELAKWLCQLGGGNWNQTAFLFKGLNVIAHGLIAVLLYWSGKRLGFLYPERSLYLYFWNPLILVHHLINGHNDLLMGLFTLLSLALALAGQWLWVLPALVASTLLKYAAGVLLPFAGLYLFKNKGWKVTLLGVGLGAFTFLLLGAPYLPDMAHFKLTAMEGNATLTHNSLHAMLYHTVELLSQGFPALTPALGPVKSGLKGLLWGGFFLLLLIQGLWLLRKKEFSLATLLQTSLLIQFLLIAVVSSKFYAWYFGMFFPLAFLLPEGHRLRKLVLLLSGTQLFSITLIGQAHILNYLLLMLLPMAAMLLPENQKQQEGDLSTRLLTS